MFFARGAGRLIRIRVDAIGSFFTASLFSVCFTSADVYNDCGNRDENGSQAKRAAVLRLRALR